jgi:thiamine pyrophosphate-dependent acetolactate synthase large subunit-like protein
MAKATAADNLCERLVAWGVNTVYGFPGDGINGILGALRRHQDDLRFVQTRHEEMASFMACGHAKFTGQVGVCMATFPRFEASQAIPYVSYAAWADLIGLKGIKVTKSDQIEDAFAQAFAADRPVIVDALTTPDEPPMPPHITFDQAKALMTSVAGAPRAGVAGAAEGVRELVHEFIHPERG